MTVEQVEAGLGRCDTDWNEDPHRALSVIEVRRDWVERCANLLLFRRTSTKIIVLLSTQSLWSGKRMSAINLEFD